MNTCKHGSIRFSRGGFHIICDICDVLWSAVTGAGERPDLTRCDSGLSELDHRVKPTESSSKNPRVMPTPGQPVKPNDSTKILRPDP